MRESPAWMLDAAACREMRDVPKPIVAFAAAQELIAYLSQCAPERIPPSLGEDAFADEAAHTEALLALTDMSLARYGPFDDGRRW